MVEVKLANGSTIHAEDPAFPADRLRGQSIREKQFWLLRTAMESLIEAGNLEPKDELTGLTRRLLQATTSIRQASAWVNEKIAKETIARHVAEVSGPVISSRETELGELKK
jgi:hypothetical protein